MSELRKKENAGGAGPGEWEAEEMSAGAPEGRGFEGWWEERSLPEKILAGIGFAILGIGLLALAGWVVMLLWNGLMPDLFGLKTVNYWQAWGLLILSQILFKGISFGDNSSSTDRKRKRELRRYMREGRPAPSAQG